jgi:hypothetical protein
MGDPVVTGEDEARRVQKLHLREKQPMKNKNIVRLDDILY